MLDVGGSFHRVARANGQPLEADAARVLNLVPWRFLCFSAGTGQECRDQQREVRGRTVTRVAVALGPGGRVAE